MKTLTKKAFLSYVSIFYTSTPQTPKNCGLKIQNLFLETPKTLSKGCNNKMAKFCLINT